MIDTKWKAFIEIPIKDGIALLDVNRPVCLRQTKEESEGTVYTVVSTPEDTFITTLSPADICKLVDEKIDVQVARIAKERKADHEAMLEFQAQQAANLKEANKDE